ncbi:MAG: RNase H-like domain-containing protein [Aeromonas sp.]
MKFEAIKAQILNKQTYTLLKLNTELIITTYASDIAVGATIGQKDGYEEGIIPYSSKTLSEQQRRYSATEKVLLAFFLILKSFDTSFSEEKQYYKPIIKHLHTCSA